MNLKILLPTEILVDTPVRKIVAEAENGAFCLLPRHVDFVAALVPGILAFEDSKGQETLVALDQGVLVKQGSEVRVSSRNGVIGEALGALRRTVEEKFEQLDEREQNVRSVIARIEAGFLRRFVEIETHG